MEVINYKFAEQYTKYPGGRYRKLGEYSGEDFRETVLRPIFKSDRKIVIDATGVVTSFSPSFLDEAFGELAKEYGIDVFLQKIDFFANDNPNLKDKMMYYVKKAVNAK